ncbi:MAG: hypothetical protein R8G01_01045 [Ilumatobacteraceae bacterium]|nr:hypothetical protein [Ilumatobacteraceae bacterium]
MTSPLGPPNEPSSPPPPQPPAMQPKYLIGLGIAAVVVLVAAVIVLVARSGGGDSVAVDDGVTTTLDETAPTTSPIPLPATTTVTSTTTTTSTTSTSTTSTTTLPPLPPVANAGDDLAADAGSDVVLTAIEMSEPNQAIVWRQIGGPDVTDGAGRLRGNDASFAAPASPSTLYFELDVTGRGGEVVTDELRIDVFEDASRAVFVDGDGGDDAGDGSRDLPFRTLVRALDFTGGTSTDIYVRSIDRAYSTGTALLDRGSSLYGGYDDDWVRDLRRPASVSGTDAGIAVFDADRAVISGVEVVGPDLATGDPSYGIVAAGVGRLEIDHASVRAGTSTGVSVGLATEAVGTLVITEARISGGAAGDGDPGVVGEPTSAVAPSGADAPADPPTPGPAGGNGGAGGEGGAGLERGDDGAGPAGGVGGEPRQAGGSGGGGAGGPGGVGGDGGTVVDDDPARAGAGQPGAPGGEGVGGSGGGGGGGLILHDGGGGGGGGGGGTGGAPGLGGTGGHLSAGMWLVDTDDVVISASTIEGGVAGSGGAGAAGAAGGQGGGGGGGAEGVSTFVDTSGAGGGGGGGGAGGQGGTGGGGGGGRSVGLVTSGEGVIEVIGSVIRGGTGGDGGPGGDGGLPGNPGSGGAGRLGGGGAGGLRADGPVAASGAPASGGDSIGWWDVGGWSRTITDTTIRAGTPGRGGGPDARSAAALDTVF